MADRRDELKSRGCPDHCVEGVHQALEKGIIDWENLIKALMHYGQVIWQILNTLFPPGPAPTPEPAAKPA